MIWFAHLGAVEANLLPFPIGNSYSTFANSTCVLLKSESARSRRQLRISVGVRLFVELKPPPVAAPVGSIDMSSIDLLKVYEKPRSSPCSNRRRMAMNK